MTQSTNINPLTGEPIGTYSKSEPFADFSDYNGPEILSDDPVVKQKAMDQASEDAAIAKAFDVGIKKFIADTGNGLNLIPRDAVKSNGVLGKIMMCDQIGIFSANSQIECNECLEIINDAQIVHKQLQHK